MDTNRSAMQFQWSEGGIGVTTTQRKGLMISHQTRPTLHLYDQYRNQPFQYSHQFHFKEL